MSSAGLSPEGAVTGIDAGDFVIRFIHDKIVFIPKHADTHTTFHFGPVSKKFDLHETLQTDGAHRTIFRMPHANLAPLVEELRAPLLAEMRGLARPLRPGWMVRNQIGAVLGLLPQDENWAAVTKVRKKTLTIDPEKLRAQIRAPEFLDELYALADGETFTLFRCRTGQPAHAIGVGQKYRDAAGRPHLCWFKYRRVTEAMNRVGQRLTALGAKYGTETGERWPPG